MTDTWDIRNWYPISRFAYDETDERILDWDKSKEFKSRLNAIWGSPYSATRTFKLTTPISMAKCMNCEHCVKLGDGTYICKCSAHSGKPERETCNYERKKR